MTTTRERQIAYIESFGHRALISAVTEMLCIDGHWFLTDEQIATLASKLVKDSRRTQHHNMRERAKAKARRCGTADVTLVAEIEVRHGSL